MLSQWYDPLLIVGTEPTLPSRVAALLDALGVDIRPVPSHRDATVTRWEDLEFGQALMALLCAKISLRTFNLRIAILSEQRRRLRKPWGMASAHMAEVLVPVLSHYLNPLVLWCQCEVADAADMLLSVQPPAPGWAYPDAMALCTRRHQALTRWLEGYRVCVVTADELRARGSAIVDLLVVQCGLTPTSGQWYQARTLRDTVRKDQSYADDEKENGDEGRAGHGLHARQEG